MEKMQTSPCKFLDFPLLDPSCNLQLPPKMVSFKIELIGTVQNIRKKQTAKANSALLDESNEINLNPFLYGVTWMKVQRDVVYISKCKMIP